MAFKFDLSNLNPATWFQFDESDVTSARVGLRVCAGDDLRKIQKATIKKRVEYKNHQRFEFEDPDIEGLNGMLWDHCIVDWENIVDATGKPIACTKEMKEILMGKSIKFSKWISECLSRLSEMEAEKEDEESKNSLATPSDSKKSPTA